MRFGVLSFFPEHCAFGVARMLLYYKSSSSSMAIIYDVMFIFSSKDI